MNDITPINKLPKVIALSDTLQQLKDEGYLVIVVTPDAVQNARPLWDDERCRKELDLIRTAYADEVLYSVQSLIDDLLPYEEYDDPTFEESAALYGTT